MLAQAKSTDCVHRMHRMHRMVAGAGLENLLAAATCIVDSFPDARAASHFPVWLMGGGVCFLWPEKIDCQREDLKIGHDAKLVRPPCFPHAFRLLRRPGLTPATRATELVLLHEASVGPARQLGNTLQQAPSVTPVRLKRRYSCCIHIVKDPLFSKRGGLARCCRIPKIRSVEMSRCRPAGSESVHEAMGHGSALTEPARPHDSLIANSEDHLPRIHLMSKTSRDATTICLQP